MAPDQARAGDGRILVGLFSGPSGSVVAFGNQGSLFTVERAAARKIVADKLGALRAIAASSPAGSRLYLVGASESQGLVLAKLEAGKLALVDSLPALADGDSPAFVIPGSDGTVAVATRGGQVLVKNDAGWATQDIDNALPASPPRAENPPARVSP